MIPADLLLGVEQEHDLFDGTKRLDFQSLFASAAARSASVPFRNDERAAILEAGYVLACDGWEAELATAPIPARNDGCLTLAREVVRCRSHMLELLHKVGVPLVHGYSTHLNISVPLGREEELANALARSIGPALILLIEARSSPGLLLRPRRGRVEVGGEYVDPERRLAAACVLLAGAVHAYLSQPEVWRLYPQVVLKKWEEAVLRPGIFLPHDAYGESMYDLGREAQLELESGEGARAGELLRSCAEFAVKSFGSEVSDQAAETLREVVSGRDVLPIEADSDAGEMTEPSRTAQEAPQSATLRMLSLSNAIPAVAPRFVDWEGAAFSWKGPSGSSLVLGLPWAELDRFFAVTRADGLPDFVASLGAPQPELHSLAQLESATVYRTVDSVALAREAQLGKRGDRKRTPVAPLRVPPSGRRWLPLVLIGLLTLVVITITCEEIGRRVLVPRTPTPTLYVRPKPTLTATPTPSATSMPSLTVTPTATETGTATPTRTRPRPTRTRTPRPQPPPPTPCDPADPNCIPPTPACQPGQPGCGYRSTRDLV